MAEVECIISETEVERDFGDFVGAVTAHCTQCDHETLSLGTSDRSVRRCLAMMREECPWGESNFYTEG